MTYFTSDLHFGHEKIIRHTGRLFGSAGEMDKALLRRWNQTIGPGDKIYILGDVTMKGPEYAAEILAQLKVRMFVLFHYPIAEWNGHLKEAFACLGISITMRSTIERIWKKSFCGMTWEWMPVA